ncbi:DUF1992 domain-containing protein [Ectobacillus funiculus]|uniref:DnaJ family domain-containing protein n=1 Tax=Ectobacillus funiculus TaxID=137993 RepID=UPI00101DF835|nr:DUF1992 domain-containing protein [Ectobacillus funiculus]
MDIFLIMAEERIRQSIQNGDFENLPGEGKPLKLDDLSGVPEDLRMGYKILKNAGMVPEEVQLKKDMLKLEDLLACCIDEQERTSVQSKLTEKEIRFNQLMEKRKMRSTGAFGMYRERLLRKFR